MFLKLLSSNAFCVRRELVFLCAATMNSEEESEQLDSEFSGTESNDEEYEDSSRSESDSSISSVIDF